MMAARKLVQSNSSRGGGCAVDLPSLDVRRALNRVRRMPMLSELFEPINWQGVVLDADHLVSDGWADQALRLGWDLRELFGIGQEYDGLACWLCDRRVALLSQDGAICLGYDGSRSIYRRVNPATLTLLWEWPR